MNYAHRPLTLGLMLCILVAGFVAGQIVRPSPISAQGGSGVCAGVGVQPCVTTEDIQGGAVIAGTLAPEVVTYISDMATAIASLQNNVAAMAAANGGLEQRVTDLENKLACMSKNGDDVVFEDCNVHIRSGSGATDGAVNGKGNLVIGYNEGANGTGSHNIVVGLGHTYSSYGSFVTGLYNTVSGPYTSVSGGSSNKAIGLADSVSGGSNNIASGESSSVSGGENNKAEAHESSIGGGKDITTTVQNQHCYGVDCYPDHPSP